MDKKLNLDIAEAISEFEEYMKEFSIQTVMYRLIFRGKGLEFESFRKYSPDDDANDIDWKASVKANQTLVKQYVEERDLKIMFIVDVGDNMLIGSTNKLKCEYAAELTLALAHLILDYGDNIGFILYSDKVVAQALPKKGRRQFEIFADELSNPDNYGGPSRIGEKLDVLIDYMDNSINAVFFVSDMIGLYSSAKKDLNSFSNKFETIALMIKDPIDKQMPNVKGEIIVEDPATKRQLIIDPSIIGREYEKNAAQHEDEVKKMLADADIDFLDITTDKPFAPQLASFLKSRLERRRFVLPR